MRRPPLLKNPTPLVRWPYILYRHGEPGEYDEEQMSFQPFNLMGCALFVLNIFGGLFAIFFVTAILMFLAQLLSLFGLVAPMW